MLFYVRCPTCGEIISYDLDKYVEELDEINNNPKYTKAQKETRSSQLLDKYGFINICCRGRIMGYIPYHKIILS